jgi:hypothetical protein
MNQLPLRTLYYGKDVPLPERKQLRAGPLSLIFEAGDLRYIRLGNREILRRVYVAIRDHNWNTLPSALSNLQIEHTNDSFRITYDMENRRGEIDFFWKGVIIGDVQGTITFIMDGQARSTFLRNRVGCCVLHPMRECAGLPCRVEKVDGTVEQGEFPKYISPHQPFMDVRSISHEVAPNVHADVRFDGDAFEMEDQRNWTDASYKTYCTPLRIPYPVEISAGTKISQSVTLTLRNSRSTVRYQNTGLTFSISRPSAARLPRIGLGVSHHGQPLTLKELEHLKRLNLSHLRVDVNLTLPNYESTLQRADNEAKTLGVPLEIALTHSDAAARELSLLGAVLEEVKPAICTWLIFHIAEESTSEKWVKLARKSLKRYAPDAKIGAGTDAFFTELNRNRPSVSALDLVCYSMNPQAHAFDNTSMVETLEAQASTVESARQFMGGLPIAITPITLKARFNPAAIGPEPELPPDELPAPVDVRQMSLFGAGWTVGSLKYLSESGVFSATYYETTGWRGVMETEEGSPLPETFFSGPGWVFPIYHVFADVGEFAGATVVPTTSSDTLRLDGIALHKNGATRILLANLTPEAQRVTVCNMAQTVELRGLNETNAQKAMVFPEAFLKEPGERLQTVAGKLELNLLPHAVARIDMVNHGAE